MMEGVSTEAASLAGHLRLSNLCWVYDNNHITIDGHTAIAFTEDVAARFQGYGWNVTRVEDANDLGMIGARLRRRSRRRAGPADVDHRRQPHRLRLAAQAGHGRGPRRAARRRGGPGDQALLRLAGGRGVPRPRRGPRALRRGDRASAAPSCAPQWDAAVRGLQGRRAGARRRTSRRCSAASCRKAGTRSCRASSRTRRAWRRARPPTRS